MSGQRIIVALEGIEYPKAIRLARRLEGRVWGFKLTDLLARRGARTIGEFGRYGNVFVDTKEYHIPSTTQLNIAPYVEAGAQLITVAAQAGDASLRAAVEVRGDAKILAVTVLSTLTSEDLRVQRGVREHSHRDLIREQVIQLAKRALACGVDGIVCAPAELEYVQELEFPEGFLKVTPNIRLSGKKVRDDDQNLERSATPFEAVALGADLLVVGRPITQPREPLEALKRIIENINPDL